jgi:hypothetical protein
MFTLIFCDKLSQNVKVYLNHGKKIAKLAGFKTAKYFFMFFKKQLA